MTNDQLKAVMPTLLELLQKFRDNIQTLKGFEYQELFFNGLIEKQHGNGTVISQKGWRLLGTVPPPGDSASCPDEDSYCRPPCHDPERQSAQDTLNKIAQSALDIQIGGHHYKDMGHHQPWEVLATWMTPEELRGYMKGTVVAYLAREQQKGGDLDIQKALHTIQLWQQVRKDEPANG